MEKRDREFRHESLQDERSISRYLTALTEGFESGTLKLSDREGEITLEPHGLIHLQVQASRKTDRLRLTLKFTWKPPDGESEDSGPLRITNGADEGEGSED